MLEKEATQAKRMEFLQFTANPVDQALIGNTRRANVLRKMTRGLDMPEDQVVKPKEMLEMEDKQAMEQTLAGLGKRVFLLHNVHDERPVLFHTRWAMSYLRGPLTRDQIRRSTVKRREASKLHQVAQTVFGHVVSNATI